MCGTAGCSSNANNSPQDGRTRKPNIVLILTDDQGFGDISSHGNELINTPVMDRIAAEGARLERFFVSPVCAPTRAALLTGRYYLRSGVHGVTQTYETMRAEEVTLAEILKQNGYATGCFGKWHNGAHYPHNPKGQGFDEFVGFCAGHWNNYFDTTLEHNNSEIKTDGYISEVCTDAAIDFINKNRGRPFFCYVPYNLPHSPFQVPDRYFDKYKDKGLDIQTACAYAMCENLDDNIGRMLRALKHNKLTNNTIVIFITDNGPNGKRYNSGMKGTKGSVDEGGVRVPCFIRWPSHIETGNVIKPIAADIDILPTIAELVGLKIPEGTVLDGKSLTPLLMKNGTEWPKRMLFTKWGNKGGVRTEQYRLVVYTKRTELYDMISDEGQTKDLASQQPVAARKLKQAYDAWLKEVSSEGFDPIPIEIGHPERAEVVLAGHEAFLASAEGKGIRYAGKYGWANDWVADWVEMDAYPYWEVKVVQEGKYEIGLMYVCSQEDVGAKVRVEIGGRSVECTISKAHDPKPITSPDRVRRWEVYEKTWAVLEAGTVKLKPWRGKLIVRALSKTGRVVMDLKAVKIKRIG